MMAFFERLLNTSMYSPHGICLLWEPELIWLHVVSDTVIALAYFSIPFALAIFVSKRRDVAFGWVFWAFAIFIMACGVTHVMSIYTLWVPIYGIEGITKALTAVASIVTAAMLWPLLPKLLAIPSPSQLQQAHAALEREGRQRRGVEEMLQKFRDELERKAGSAAAWKRCCKNSAMSRRRNRRCGRPRRWKRSGSSPAASPMTSTTS